MTRTELRTRVSRNLGDPSNNRFDPESINDSLQKGYNLLAILSGCIQKSTMLPFPTDTPYMNLRQMVPNYFAPIGIYNLKTHRWMVPVTQKYLNEMRWDWERWTGEPTNLYTVIDFNRIGIFPYQTVASGTFILWYWAHPGTMEDNGPVFLPDSITDILESYATADILQNEREFVKANKYWLDFINKYPSLDVEVNNIAKFDKNLVIQPYWPLGMYGSGGTGEMPRFVDNIIPSGAIDGVNNIFDAGVVFNPTSSVLLMKNGVVQFEGIEYDLVGGRYFHFKTPFIPTPAHPPFKPNPDELRFWGRVS